MLELPIGVNVECTDGRAGTSTHIIFDPTSRKVTHLVASEDEPMIERSYLIPIDTVAESRHDVIKLSCTLNELAQMEPFTEVHYIKNPGPEPGYPADSVYIAPYVSPLDMEYLPMEIERIPIGELAIRRGAVIEATDGYVGRLGEFLIDLESNQVTHLVLQEGHSLGKREITLPVSAIDQTLENTIYLKLDKSQVAKLPSIPIQRDYGRSDEAVGLELITKIFDAPEQASQALGQVKQLRKEHKELFKIHNAAVLIKDAEGKAVIKETAEVDAKQGRLFGAIVGGLFGLLGGPIGVVVGALAGAGTGGFAAKHIDMGFSNDFLESFQELLRPGSSALLVLVEKKGADELYKYLAKDNDVVLRQALSDQIVDRLLREEAPGGTTSVSQETS